MGFKDQVQADMAVFFNPDEFGELHRVGDRQLHVIVDNDRLMKRSQVEFDGLHLGEVLFYVRADEYGALPQPGALLFFDGKPHAVFNSRDDGGVYEIILTQNRS